MKKSVIISIAVVSAILLIGLLFTQRGSDTSSVQATAPVPVLPKITLRQEWFPNSNYAGALFASKKFAERNGIQIVIQPGADNIDPVKSVLSGESMFGDAGADKIIAANQKGADLIVVGVLNNISPTCFIALKERNIRTPSDFTGKRVGVLTGTATEYVYRMLLAKQKIKKSTLTEVEAPFDLATFISGAYDVRPAFIYDEPVSLDIKNVPYTIIKPTDYGVSFLGTVYFTQRKFAQEHPELVQKFINSVALGWSAALKYPDQAISYLKEFDKTIDEDRERRAMNKSEDYFKGYNGQILRVDQDAWDQTVRNLQQLGVVGKSPTATTVDMHFLDEFYRTQK
jgi:NitT/TauT family transport system substrate-binding protein